MAKFIYLDNAATTPCDPRVVKAMLPFFTEKFGNASSLHQAGRETRSAIDSSRDIVAKFFNVEPEEVIFTGSGTEADMLGVKGILEGVHDRTGKTHVITSAIEHKAVLNLVYDLEKRGFQITVLPVDKYGRISPDDVKKAITGYTALVSIMAANSEIGTTQPIKDIGKICREKGVFFHTDAVQLVGKVKIDLQEDLIDALSLSAHKFHGPKGVGALIVRKNVPLRPQILGGGQEKRRRAATENTPGIVGLAAALQLCEEYLEKPKDKMVLGDYLVERVLKEISGSILNGHPDKRLRTHVNFSFPGVEGESLLLRLDLEGVCASTGSACSAGSLEPSHVLLACGILPELANCSLRLTLSRDTTKKEIDQAIIILKKVVAELREMSVL
ncbi:MAG: cysteine desulfurase family protein [Patescibacteria group bacterium]|nr:cysteine desulfurase family protein [Patescibacteria group bacterium]